MQHGNTNLVLGPNLDFFRFFGNPSGQAPVEAASTPATAASAASVRADPRAVATVPGK
jgi:hypothetical protein